MKRSAAALIFFVISSGPLLAEVKLTDTPRNLAIEDVALLVDDSGFARLAFDAGTSPRSEWVIVHIYDDSNLLIRRANGNTRELVWLSSYDTTKLVVNNLL